MVPFNPQTGLMLQQGGGEGGGHMQFMQMQVPFDPQTGQMLQQGGGGGGGYMQMGGAQVIPGAAPAPLVAAAAVITTETVTVRGA